MNVLAAIADEICNRVKHPTVLKITTRKCTSLGAVQIYVRYNNYRLDDSVWLHAYSNHLEITVDADWEELNIDYNDPDLFDKAVQRTLEFIAREKQIPTTRTQLAISLYRTTYSE